MNESDFTKKATILMVDDAPENLTLMSSLLKDDYKVKIANSGEKALKIAASDSPPDLILLDIMMPGMDGYEVCRRLKRDPGTMNIPVIFLTAKSDVEDEKKGLELGAIDYIIKPFSQAVVMTRVKNHLAIKERRLLEGIDARLDAPATPFDNLIAQVGLKLPEEQDKTAVTVDRKKLKEVCGRLEYLLADNDAEAAGVLNANAELLNDAFPDHSHQIGNCIRIFDFEAALVALRAATGKSI